MELRNIPMPGLVPKQAYDIQVRISGQEDTGIDLILSYGFGTLDFKYDPNVDYSKQPSRFGEIVFTTVIEHRFYWDTFCYNDFPEIAELEMKHFVLGDELGLIEVVGSPYTENMLSKGVLSHLEDRMGGGPWGGVSEADVKHYRISFDKYGCFDILALGVRTREYELEC